jgi:hypothetical protein
VLATFPTVVFQNLWYSSVIPASEVGYVGHSHEENRQHIELPGASGTLEHVETEIVDELLPAILREPLKTTFLLLGAEIECLGVIGGIWKDDKPVNSYHYRDYAINNENPTNPD